MEQKLLIKYSRFIGGHNSLAILNYIHIYSQAPTLVYRSEDDSWVLVLFFHSVGPGELRLAGLVASVLIHWVPSLASSLFLNQGFLPLFLLLSFLCPLLSPVTVRTISLSVFVWLFLYDFFNLNLLCCSRGDIKLGLKSWLDSNVFFHLVACFGQYYYFYRGSSRENHSLFT